ncbi:MAG: Fic family protein [Erysipelotrichaceae bacterium]|nr:Fic family protein [Erysipelotrichaceae bacterium]
MQKKEMNMHKYDYSFLKDFKITSKLIGLSNVIAESNYKVNVQEKENPVVFLKLHKKAIIDSAVSSNRIEGIETSEKRNRDLLENNDKPLNHSEEEISGYKDAIVFISDHYEEIEINEDTIKYLHSMLMYYSSKSKGQYKKTDNEITARYENGNSEVIFQPVKSNETDKHMKQFINAYNRAKNDNEINQLLLIPCFIVDFLAIHPFFDGNGRISRLLTLLLLYKEGYRVGKYISYEKMIEQYKWNYYQELNFSQTGWHDNENDYSPFIVFHFQMLYRCYKEISERFISEETDRKISKRDRIENTVMKSVVPISKTEIADVLPDISVTTIEKVLGELIKKNKIRKIGTYKNAKYVKSQS